MMMISSVKTKAIYRTTNKVSGSSPPPLSSPLAVMLVGIVLVSVATTITTTTLQFHRTRTTLLVLEEIDTEERWHDNNIHPDRPRRHGGKEQQYDNNKVIDILSIGSQERPELLTAQKESWASHRSVRHFYNATEIDDADPECHQYLTPHDVYNISVFCKHRRDDLHPLRYYLQNFFANVPWLKSKSNPVGWMCAQRRPLHGLYKVLTDYSIRMSSSTSNEKEKANNTRSTAADNVLPDYLILLDDDTYFNIEKFQQMLVSDQAALNAKQYQYQHQHQRQQTVSSDLSPRVFAGCLVRYPIHIQNFTFPFGGYGTIFNRASLERLLRPMHCPQDTEFCTQLEENIWGEKNLFQNGMTLIELMQAFVSNMPFRDKARGLWKGTDGFCAHSDWMVGYFVNFYNISSHTRTVVEPKFVNVRQSRMEPWHESTIYAQKEGFCRNEDVDHCQPDDVTCHYMTTEAMINYTNIERTKWPHRFHPSIHSLAL